MIKRGPDGGNRFAARALFANALNQHRAAGLELAKIAEYLRDDSEDRGDGGLHLPHLLPKVRRNAACLARERLDLIGDHGKTAPSLARARGFDAGIQRKQLGLIGDRGDLRQSGAHFIARGCEARGRALHVADEIGERAGDGNGRIDILLQLIAHLGQVAQNAAGLALGLQNRVKPLPQPIGALLGQGPGLLQLFDRAGERGDGVRNAIANIPQRAAELRH